MDFILHLFEPSSPSPDRKYLYFVNNRCSLEDQHLIDYNSTCAGESSLNEYLRNPITPVTSQEETMVIPLISTEGNTFSAERNAGVSNTLSETLGKEERKYE